MKKFVGRKQELKALEDTYQERDAVILISGMRHVGKSGLINKFTQDKPTLYFSAVEASDELNRKNMLRLISEYFGKNAVNKNMDLPEWGDLFRLYANKPEVNRKVLVIDNIDNLIQNNPGFLKQFAHAWEQYLKPKNVLLIGILSNSSVLASLENQKNPLMHIANLRIKLQPVSFIEMLRDYPHRSYSELVSLYSLTGGIPKYWTFFNEADTIREQLKRVEEHMLNPQGWFYSMPISWLDKDVWEPHLYLTLLSYIADGAHSLEDLSALTGFKNKELLEYLNNLELIGFIKKGVSITERRYKPKKARFYIANPTLHFWLKFVFPNQSYLESNQDEIVINKIKKEFFEYIKEPFREICQEVFLAGLKQNSMDFNVTSIGRFWNDNTEIPIVAVDKKNKKLFIADVCFNANKYSVEDFRNFINKSLYVKELNKFKDYSRTYGLFTATKPSDELLKYVIDDDDLVLFSGTTLFQKQ